MGTITFVALGWRNAILYGFRIVTALPTSHDLVGADVGLLTDLVTGNTEEKRRARAHNLNRRSI